jgi:hypothetical protein
MALDDIAYRVHVVEDVFTGFYFALCCRFIFTEELIAIFACGRRVVPVILIEGYFASVRALLRGRYVRDEAFIALKVFSEISVYDELIRYFFSARARHVRDFEEVEEGHVILR